MEFEDEDRVLPGSCPDHVSHFHRKDEQLGYIVIYRSVRAGRGTSEGQEPQIIAGGRGSVLVSPRGSCAGCGEGLNRWGAGLASLWVGRGSPMGFLGPLPPLRWGFLTLGAFYVLKDHFCIVRSEEKYSNMIQKDIYIPWRAVRGQGCLKGGASQPLQPQLLVWGKRVAGRKEALTLKLCCPVTLDEA